MARTRLIDLVSEPENLDEKTMDSLKEALDAYPFFQAGRMMWIKNLHKLDHIRYNSELKLAAAFIPDRSKLFFLINDLYSSFSGGNKDGETGSAVEVADVDGQISETGHLNGTKKSVHKEKEFEEGGNGLSDNMGLVVGDDANYFEVDDSYPSHTGEVIDFSVSRDNSSWRENVVDRDEKQAPEPDNMVLPSADLLDYERGTYMSPYSLEKSVPPSADTFKACHSFSEWLNLMRHHPVSEIIESAEEQDSKVSSATDKKPAKPDLIDSFLSNAGTGKRMVPASDSEVSNEDFSVKSVEESEDLMTETLAEIHIKQQRYQKAVDIFERLNLKYPEKSAYFARRIEEMEELINNQ
jgi:hypothetical protein